MHSNCFWLGNFLIFHSDIWNQNQYDVKRITVSDHGLMKYFPFGKKKNTIKYILKGSLKKQSLLKERFLWSRWNRKRQGIFVLTGVNKTWLNRCLDTRTIKAFYLVINLLSTYEMKWQLAIDNFLVINVKCCINLNASHSLLANTNVCSLLSRIF